MQSGFPLQRPSLLLRGSGRVARGRGPGVIGHFVLLGLVPGVVVGLGRDDGGRWQAWPRQISHII